VDVINCDKFCDNLFTGLNLQEVKVPFFPYESDVAVITVMRYNSDQLRRVVYEWYTQQQRRIQLPDSKD